MMYRWIILGLALGLAPLQAQERIFTLSAPPALVETGFLKHLLPRFSLKKSIRITVTDGATDAQIGSQGIPVFRQGDVIWHLAKTDGPYTDAFEEWLLSDVGRRTIEAFAPDGTALFSADVAIQVEEVAVALEGDAVLGEKISLERCGRCHVVSEKNRMNAIGSTPSFSLLRSFPDWQERFGAFVILKPHGSFTQVEGVTDPFPENLPSPIAPIEVTLDEIDAIMAFVDAMAPADLGAPLQSN